MRFLGLSLPSWSVALRLDSFISSVVPLIRSRITHGQVLWAPWLYKKGLLFSVSSKECQIAEIGPDRF